MITAWLAFQMRGLGKRAQAQGGEDGDISVGRLAAASIPRFLFVLAAFWLGIGVLELHALYMALAFGLAYVAYLPALRLATARAG